jgi:hypothetical protein
MPAPKLFTREGFGTGYTLVMEVTAQETGQTAAGFGSGGKPDLWIGGEGKLEKLRRSNIRGRKR